MYYLQSRYYDPVVGRFVNADDPQINLMYTVLEINRYAYCINDPINNTDINGNIATFLMKKIGSVLLGLVLGVVSQFLVDVIVSAIRRRWALSSASTYVSAAAQGALDALWGGGIVKEVCKALLSNLLKQLVDMIKNGSNFNFLSLVESIFDGLFNYVLDKAIKTPQFIRDIKKEARKKGLKGTRKLVKFLNTRIRQTKIAKFSISTIFTAVKSFVGDAISFIVKCAKELYQDFISIFSVPSNVPTVNDPGWCC